MFRPDVFSFDKILLINIILVILLSSADAVGNYPSSNQPKPCARKKAVITKTLPICIPSGQDSWTKESADNCGILKEQCPEFNQAECMWYTWQPAGCSHEVTLPCCRLKYYAKKKTWMEIYYANQYGTSDMTNTVYDVIEIHRFIKEPAAFVNCEQEDFPKNVLDPKGERGLTWVPLVMTAKNSITVGDQICGNNPTGKTLCTGVIKGLVSGQYPDGFKNPPEATSQEKSCQAKFGMEYLAECSHALVDNVKTDVCKVTYIRTSEFVPQGKVQPVNTWMPFLEVQAYSVKQGNGSMIFRYSYFHYEPQPYIQN